MTKVTTLAEAVASIPAGSHVSLSGFATARCTMAFAHEVIRQKITKLTAFPSALEQGMQTYWSGREP